MSNNDDSVRVYLRHIIMLLHNVALNALTCDNISTEKAVDIEVKANELQKLLDSLSVE